MKTIIEKLLDFSNMVTAGFIVSFIFKPEFAVFWKIIFPVSTSIYLIAIIAIILLEKGERNNYIERRKSNDGE